jgi:hypothetical protein
LNTTTVHIRVAAVRGSTHLDQIDAREGAARPISETFVLVGNSTKEASYRSENFVENQSRHKKKRRLVEVREMNIVVVNVLRLWIREMNQFLIVI